jgi:hypothetical protein
MLDARRIKAWTLNVDKSLNVTLIKAWTFGVQQGGLSVFRPVPLPNDVAGSLWLHSMPGRREPLEEALEQVRIHGVQAIVCLAGPEEIRAKSPSYAAALDAKTVPCAVESFPIPDFGVPGDREAFWSLAAKTATQLKAGGRVLIHCGAGIGRTGTLATCVLLALGQSPVKAQQAVSTTGSHPETAEQNELVSWCAARAHPMRWRRTSRFSGSGLALLAPPAERQRSIAVVLKIADRIGVSRGRGCLPLKSTLRSR